MEELKRFNLFTIDTPDYSEIVDVWRSRKLTNPFSGHFLIRLTSELNQIEGISMDYNSTREIFERETVRNYSGNIRDLYSVLNNLSVANYLNEMFRKRVPLSVPLIKEAHRLLMHGSFDRNNYENLGERAGQFKKNESCVGRYDVGAPPYMVEGFVVELCEMCNGSFIDPLKLAAAFHCYFQHIRPFADGNGRVGRWLTNYLLVLHDHPPIVFNLDTKAQYASCLEQFDRTEDPESMYDYLKMLTRDSYSAWCRGL